MENVVAILWKNYLQLFAKSSCKKHVVSAVIIIVLVNAFLSITGYFINQIFFFVLLPAGAATLGYFSSKGVLFGVERCDVMPSKITVIIYSVITSLICFLGIYIVSYFTAYISSDMSMNHLFSGKHISNFVLISTNEKINFFTYMKYLMQPRTVSLFYFGGGSSSGLPMSNLNYDSTFNWFRFIVEGAAYIIFGVLELRKLLGVPHCTQCNKILKRKNIEMFNIDDETSLEPIYNEILTGNYQNKNQVIKPPIIGNKRFKMLNISYCPECLHGYLQMRVYEPEYFIVKEHKLRKEEIDIDKELVMKLLENNDTINISNSVQTYDVE